MSKLKIKKIELTLFEINLKDLKENNSGIGISFSPGSKNKHLRFGIRIYDTDGTIGEYIPPRGRANVVMAAVLAKGKTEIYNAACEPYLQQLCLMLNNMGAKITGIGSNLITIEGVKKLGGCSHKILPDMIEIGSFIGLAAMTRSEITIKNVQYKKLGIIPETFKKLGIKIKVEKDNIKVLKQKSYKIKTL